MAQAGVPILLPILRVGECALRWHSRLVTARPPLQMGFYHRNEVYQAYVDTPLSRFAAEDPQMPESLRMVLSAELCANLAETDILKATSCRLAALLEAAFAKALDERCSHSLSHAPRQDSAFGRS